MATTAQPMTVYGERDQVKELGIRLQNLMPSAQQFSTAEATAVAQIAVAHRLDPFNGEVWGLKNYDGKWYGVMVGIKGLRKCSNRQAAQENTIYWKEFVQVDPAKYHEPADAIVFECLLRDTATMQAYGQSLKSLTSSDVPYAEAIEMIGRAPCVVGIGIAHPSEKSKMKINQRAKKRSEADALKQRFDVEFGEGVITDADREAAQIADVIEGSATEAASIEDGEPQYVTDDTTQAEQAETPAATKRTVAQNLADLGFGSSPEENREAPKYRASGAKIVKIVAEIVGCKEPEAAKLIMAKYKPSDMLTEQEAHDFATGGAPEPEQAPLIPE